MKTLIFTDNHGRDPSNLIDWAVKAEGIEKLASLGDLDTPSVLRAILTKTKEHGLPFIFTPGNHDYHYVKHIGLDQSSEMYQSASEYITDWFASPTEKKFVLAVIEGKIPNAGLVVPDKEIVYAHASLVDKFRECEDVPDNVWARLLYHAGKLDLNFRAMQDLDDYRLFFRGHDHINAISVQHGNITKETEFGYWGKHKVDIENARTVVTVGAFYDGEFALYDSDSNIVDLKCWNFSEGKPYE